MAERFYRVYEFHGGKPELESVEVGKTTDLFVYIKGASLAFRCKPRLSKQEAERAARTPKEAWLQFAKERRSSIEALRAQILRAEEAIKIAEASAANAV